MKLPARPLAELLPELVQAQVDGDARCTVAGMTHDSRCVEPGYLFVAYAGVHEDVHRYLADAARRGAVAALVERPGPELRRLYELPSALVLVTVPDARQARALLAGAWCDWPSRSLAVVGITGTDGKTTTAFLVHAILHTAGRRVGLVSTVEARLGEERESTGAHVTTPEAEELQAFLARMRAKGFDSAVLEATSHGLAQHRLTGVAFDVAVLTNITENEALEYHGSFAAYREAKALLFRSLVTSEAKPGIGKTAVLNAADPAFDTLRAMSVPRHLSYAVGTKADFWADRIEHGPFGLAFTAVTPVGRLAIRSPLLGTYNAANILAAMAAAHALDVPPSAWLAGIESVRGIPGRMQRIEAGQPFLAIVDFAHTPNALAHALQTARQLAPSGRVIAVFGCAGLRHVGKRPAMGQVAAELADRTIITAEDPRTEDVGTIMAAIAEGCRRAGAVEGHSFYRVADRFAAIRRACELARAGDVVIVCGKGHEPTMCFGETEYPWDDRAALQAALEGRRYGQLPTAEGAGHDPS